MPKTTESNAVAETDGRPVTQDNLVSAPTKTKEPKEPKDPKEAEKVRDAPRPMLQRPPWHPDSCLPVADWGNEANEASAKI